jgi:FAD/FMN-containing dehydrogenase
MESVGKALHAKGIRDVRTDGTSRAAYSSDASLYRVTPAAVVFPADHGEVARVVEVCADRGVPLTARGAGTSVAGNAVGPGVVLDFSRYMNRVLAVDPEARTAVVQPGAIQAVLQRAAAPYGLRFGPDPSTHTRCTIGGMIGNNSCGSRSLGYGRTSDNVAALRVLTATGEDLHVGGPGERRVSPILAELEAVTRSGLATIRTEFGRFGRQVS